MSYAAVVRERTLASARGRVGGMPSVTPEEVLSAPGFEEGIERIARQTGRLPDEVVARAAGDIREMAAAHSQIAAELFGRFSRLLLRSYAVEVDEAGVAALRALNADHALVFLPNHRSYLDPFVLRSTLLDRGFPANHCFGGSNMAWWPMGSWMRRSGNIVLRRAIGDDPVYKFVLREYLACVMRRRMNLEWYLEGGRTRTGKLRPPRFGLLSYLFDAFDRLDEPEDVYLVPCALVYDSLDEVRSLIAEQQGLAKAPETAAWLVNYPRVSARGRGEIHLRFGEPLSLREAVGHGRRRVERNRVEKVAFEVCHRINRATPVTPTALVMLALLAVEDRALTLEQVRSRTRTVAAYLTRRGMAATGEVTDPELVRTTLDALTAGGIVTRFDDGLYPVWSIAPDRHLEAAFYRNSVVHFLVDRAIVELVLAAAAEGEIDLATDAWSECLRLRELLQFEFFFPAKGVFRRELEHELSLIAPDWRTGFADLDGLRTMLAHARPHVAHRALHSFLETYVVLAERLAAHGTEEAVDEDAFIAECFGVARQRRLQHRLRDADAISTEVLRGAWRLAAHRGLVTPGGAELAKCRAAFAGELRGVLDRLDRMRELAVASLDAEPAA
jgi:glycerol-3-phosphate O-acyltransferase